MLRAAREMHGLQIDVVAAALKVPVKKLQALEDDDIGALPDPVFARALAASVCRALRVDPAPVLAKLPGAVRPGLAQEDRTIASNIRSGAPRTGRAPAWMPSRGVVAMVGLLLVGAAALLWLPATVFERLGASVSQLTARNGSADGASGTVMEPPVAAVEPLAPATPVAPVMPVAPAAGTSPTPGTPGSSAASAATAATTGNAVVFSARSETWITVTEAGGKQLLRRTVQPGETVGLSGTLPLAVVVGRASGVDVQVMGKPFDLAPFTKSGGVARFEVKS